MGEQLEAKAVEAIDKAMHGVDVLAAKLTELAQQYGPDVVDAALVVARVEAAQVIMSGATASVIGAVAVYYGLRMFRAGCEQGRIYRLPETCYDAPEGSFLRIAGVITLSLGVVSAICAAIKLSNLWAWVGMFEPKLYIAHRLLSGVL